VSRGRSGTGVGNIDAARRKRTRRAAAVRVERAKRERLRVAERRHARRFLPCAVRIARRHSRSAGWSMHVERNGGGTGLRRWFGWNQAVIQLAPCGISIHFTLADRRGSGSATAASVRLGRQLVRPCPSEILQSGNRRAFAEWLEDGLKAASERLGGS
jgi:hypothetical protein